MRFFKEPFIHFILLGAVIFGASAYLIKDSDRADTRVFVDKETVQSIKESINKRLGKMSEVEFKKKAEKVLEAIIQQEILYREGLSLNLDRNDMVIKKRIAYKMNMLAIEKANREPVTPIQVETYYKENEEQFTVSKKVSFRHVLFSFDQRGTDAARDSEDILAKIHAGELKEYKTIVEYGDKSPSFSNVRNASFSRIERAFGTEFAQQIDKIQSTGWVGNMKSSKGMHLVEVQRITPSKLKPLDDVRIRIKARLESVKDVKIYDDFYREAKKKYSIVMEREF